MKIRDLIKYDLINFSQIINYFREFVPLLNIFHNLD